MKTGRRHIFSLPPATIGLCVFVLLYCLAWSVTVRAESGPKARQEQSSSLVIGYSAQVFYNVDPRDIIGLTRVWTRLAERNMKLKGETSVVVYKNVGEAETALVNNEVDILVMIPEEYFRLRATIPLTPVLSADYGKHFYNELLLMVREDSGITRISQLRGKSLRIESGQKGSIPLLWLDSFLTARVSANARSFFGGISEFPKAAQVIMPVFFGQADACLASRASFETMEELNPQLGRKLRVLDRSPGFNTGIIAVRGDIRNPRRDAMVEALRDMHGDPKGRQLLTLFRINRLVPFANEHLTSVEKIIREQRGKTETSIQRKRSP